MNSYSPGRRPRRPRGGGRRRGNYQRVRGPQEPAKTQKKTFWQRVAEFFGNGGDKKKAPPAQPRNGAQPSRPARKPERVEMTSPRLNVGNLSFDATESDDFFELFNCVGHVQNAEVVSYRHNQRSKGFAFVQMQTVGGSAMRCGGIARQGISWSQACCERREIRPASAALGRSYASNVGSACCATGRYRTTALSLNLQISACLDVIRAGLQLFDPHLFQEPAALDFLRGHHLEAFDQLRVPVVAFHAHQCAARFVHPQQNVRIRRLPRRRAQLQFPAFPGSNIFLA